jgi:mono/diheme cytochrome c family protein
MRQKDQGVCYGRNEPIVAAMCLLALAQGFGTAVENPVGVINRGHALARTWCTGCHYVEAREMTAKDAVPSFNAIAATSSTTEQSLRAFLQNRHQSMPNWWLTLRSTSS